MKDYEKYVAEEIMPRTRIYDAGFTVNDYARYRRNSGKLKRKECGQCSYNQVCEGPWKEYVEIFGWDEFKPVSPR
jgi:radical SAM protein with 4Fe4S-binding SPASM domain